MVVVILLCGLAIDSGLLYLAKARISRAADGAALAAVGNFHRSDDPATNRSEVAKIIRNFAAANYVDLAAVSGTASEVEVSPTTYTYNFFDPVAPVQDPNGAYRRFVKVTLTTAAGGQITSAQCIVRCPVTTLFIGMFTSAADLKVSSGAVATRNPRLIMVVVDRSGSMLIPPASGNPGCVGLAPAIVTFLNFFDTSSDSIGLVSFSSNARLEIPLTTNFLYAATNVLYEAYDIVNDAHSYGGSSSWYVPGRDPEADQPGYQAAGVRRFRFGGQTAADEGIRLGLEQMMANPGFSNPNVVKYMIIFTDGAWNTTRTLVAAPGYTNVVTGPPLLALSIGTNYWLTGTNPIYAYTQVPAMSPWADYWKAVGTNIYDPSDHANDQIQSMATNSVDRTVEANSTVSSPLEGAPQTYTSSTFLGNLLVVPVYTTNLNVWVPPGAVDYVYRAPKILGILGLGLGTPVLSPHETIVSDMTNPAKTVSINLGPGDSNVLVVPGYVIDGVVYDGLDLAYPATNSDYPAMRSDNYVCPWTWPDASPVVLGSDDGTGGVDGSESGAYGSVERNLMFRNYMNLLTGFYVFRPDDPLGPSTDIDPFTGAVRPLNPVGPYYPSAAFYWPFDDVGLDQFPTFSLLQPSLPDPSPNGKSRAIAYSINMLSPAAAPEWSGELFYHGKNAQLSGATSASSLMASKSDWQAGIPGWVTGAFDHPGITETDGAHNTNQIPTAAVWRPTTFNGAGMLAGTDPSALSPSDSANHTGGYVMDGTGKIYRNAMAWSGRPTHYYDFSRSTWVRIGSNHVKNGQMLPLGNWKASEYCWHARAAGVTIYTVGYGGSVSDQEQAFLATLANATNTTAGGGSNILTANYNTQQPIGQQFYATNADQIGVDFSNVATAINAALTQ